MKTRFAWNFGLSNITIGISTRFIISDSAAVIRRITRDLEFQLIQHQNPTDDEGYHLN